MFAVKKFGSHFQKREGVYERKGSVQLDLINLICKHTKLRKTGCDSSQHLLDKFFRCSQHYSSFGRLFLTRIEFSIVLMELLDYQLHFLHENLSNGLMHDIYLDIKIRQYLFWFTY